jgi:TusA-related sulfurtransferase
MSDTLTCDAELDASGLNCPLPLLKAKMELNRLASGAVLKVIATDAGSQRDFRTLPVGRSYAAARNGRGRGLHLLAAQGLSLSRIGNVQSATRLDAALLLR